MSDGGDTRPPRGATVKGWCPGALRPMASGDGLVVRLRPTAGRLAAPVAAAIADLAERHGNGRIDLTQRGNLQLRGVTDATFPALAADLGRLGLLDADDRAEARRNLVVSPLGAPATVALATAIERALAAAADLDGLAAKFAFVVDDGSWPRPAGLGFDVAFVADGDRDGAGWSLVVPDGAALLALGRIDGATVPAAAVALARAVRDDHNGARRMADLVRRPGGPERLAAAAGIAFAPAAPARPAVPEVIGRRGAIVGVGVPFGQTTAAGLAALAAAGPELRLTPFRAVLLPGLADPDGVRAALGAAGFVTDAADPRRAVAACTGAPACASAHQPARADAARLAVMAAGLPGAGVRLHVSGCAKGCARPAATAVTLVGTEDGYDLVLDGTTRDRPRQTGLAAADLAAALAALDPR
jgi:precorrin-3B synthase